MLFKGVNSSVKTSIFILIPNVVLFQHLTDFNNIENTNLAIGSTAERVYEYRNFLSALLFLILVSPVNYNPKVLSGKFQT